MRVSEEVLETLGEPIGPKPRCRQQLLAPVAQRAGEAARLGQPLAEHLGSQQVGHLVHLVVERLAHGSRHGKGRGAKGHTLSV